MVKSDKITVTDARLRKALSQVVETTSSGKSTVKAELKESLSLQIGEVLKFFPGTDKILVRLNSTGEEVRCVQSHLIVGTDFNISLTPQGEMELDTEYDELGVTPNNTYYALILNIRDTDNLKEYAVLGYISRDNTKLTSNASPGMFQILRDTSLLSINEDGLVLQVDGDTRIEIINGVINLTGQSVMVNSTPISTSSNGATSTVYYTRTEVDALLKTLTDRITVLENRT
jgi:hypothetical protein